MAGLVEISKTAEIKDGTMMPVIVNDSEILIARVGDKYYASDNRCPHMGGKLSQGKLEGTIVTCPLHNSQFDLETGKVIRWLKGTGLLSKLGETLKSPRPINIYNVKVEGDRVMVEI